MKKYLIFSGIIFSSVFAVFLLLYLVYDLDFYYSLTDAFVSVLLFIGFSIGIKNTAKFIKLERSELSKFILSHLSAAIVISLAWLGMSNILMEIMLGQFNISIEFFTNTQIIRLIISASFYLLLISYHYLIIYYDNYKEKLIKESELKNLITEAEIKSLKFQINPHFIFNSLNSIAALTSIDPEKARDMVIKLADFLRYTLSTNSKQMNSLKEEISNIEKYLLIEKIRFGEKFVYSFEIEDSLLNYNVPNMLLQPIFENAIKYGVYESLEQASINLKAELIDGFLNISVRNSLEENGRFKRKGAGVGLSNIKERLRLIYNQDDLIKMNNGEEYYEVQFTLPVTI